MLHTGTTLNHILHKRLGQGPTRANAWARVGWKEAFLEFLGVTPLAWSCERARAGWEEGFSGLLDKAPLAWSLQHHDRAQTRQVPALSPVAAAVVAAAKRPVLLDDVKVARVHPH
eukprot:364569-Chlamydomonas_euryale.AAC.4